MKCWCGGEAISPQVCGESVYHNPSATGRKAAINKLYLSGPMSNYPQCNYPAFNKAARSLRRLGFYVVNPAEFGSRQAHMADMMREDLTAMMSCDGLALMDSWWESRGSCLEVQTAGMLRMPARPVADWNTTMRRSTK
jgi:hypothetical protein